MNASLSGWKLAVVGIGMFGLWAQSPAPPAGSKPGAGKSAPTEQAPTEKSEPGGPKAAADGFSGLLDSLWLKVRQTMMSEESEENAQAQRTSAVAGIRAAKSPEDSLKPIWKGKSPEPPLPADQKLFEQAKASYETADYSAAISALLELQKNHRASSLRPPAQALLALCYLQTQKTAEAKKTADDFLSAFPEHPLAEQMRELKSRLEPRAAP